MFNVSLTEFTSLQALGSLTFSSYQSTTTYYLVLSNATGVVLFTCAVSIADATAQGFAAP